MSDLGDLVRLLDSFGIEHEVLSVWSGLEFVKLVEVPDPEGPVNDWIYMSQYRFSPEEGKFQGYGMYYMKYEEKDDEASL